MIVATACEVPSDNPSPQSGGPAAPATPPLEHPAPLNNRQEVPLTPPAMAVRPTATARRSSGLATTTPPGGPREGIEVRGHGTIEVRNQDGTLALRRDF